MAGVLEATEKDIDDIKTSTSNGFTVMREPDWLRIKPLLKSLNAMKAERKELLKMLKEFEEASTAKETSHYVMRPHHLQKKMQGLKKSCSRCRGLWKTL